MVNTSSSSNKRAHIRHSVDLPVRLSGSGFDGLSVQMADFCLGGMMLELGNAEAGLAVQDAITIELEVAGMRGNRAVSLTGEVVRLEGSTAGVRFIEPDASALLAVQNHVRGQAESRRSEVKAQSGRKASPAQSQAAISAVRQVLEAFLHQRMELFFPQAEEALLDAADKMSSNQAQHAYFEAGKLLARGNTQLQANFLAEAAKNLDLVAQGRQVDAGETFKAESGGLSLVDKELFEDWLTLKVMATRAESQFHDQLLHLQLRFDELFGISLSARRNPLHPAFICNAFGGALRLIPLKGNTDRIILEAFEREVVTALGQLYEQCNEILADTGVLSELDVGRYIAERYGHHSAAPVPPPAPAKPAASDPAPSEPAESEASREATPPSPAPGEAPAGSRSGERATTRPTLAARQFNLQQNIARHAYETAQRLLSVQHLSETRDRIELHDPQPAARRIPADKASTLLAGLQAQSEVVPEAPLEERVQEALGQEFGPDSSPDHQLTAALEIIQGLFDGILSNPAISEPVRMALRRLEVPFLRLLLMDDSFLKLEAHPARQVLNRMAKLGVRGSANLEQHEREIIDGVSAINSRFEGDVSVFEESLVRLDTLSTNQDALYLRNLKRVQENSEGKHKLAFARREVDKALERRIGGKRVPTAVLSLIDAGWRALLLRTLLRGGRDSSQWHEYLGVIDVLIAAGDKAPERDKLQALLGSIKRGLREVDEKQTQNGRLLSDLRELLRDRSGEGNSAPMVDVPKGMVDGGEHGEMRELEKRWLKKAQRVEVGDVFEEHSAEESPALLRLAWVDEDRTTFVFVNPQGLQVFDLSLADFAARLANGEIRPAEQEQLPAVDRGLDQVVSRVYEKMAASANRDELSGLLNRREFERRLRHRLAEHPDCRGTLVHFDLDQFNLVNNVGGPQAGDALIAQLGPVLKDMFPAALIARTGGDEFAVWLEGVTPEGGKKAAESFCQRVNQERFACAGHTFSVTCSAGVVHRLAGGELADELMRGADSACHAAKEQGRNRVNTYTVGDQDLARRDDVMGWVTRLNEALDQNRLALRCQRIESAVPSDEAPAYEVLISIVSEQGEMIPPADFLAAAEQYNRMHALDRWVISNVLRWMHANPGVVANLDHVSINLSGHSLNDAALPEFLFEHFQRYPVPRERLCFEVTETAAIANLDDAADFIREMQDMGCRFSLDDFGSGLASYGHLKHLPVDYIKIDGTFIRNILGDQADQALVRSINEMGHLMGKRTIAEYVEDKAIRDCLADIGVDYVQGYGIEKPRPLESLG